MPPAETEREFASWVCAEFAAREAEIAAQPDVDEDDVRWAELALELVDRATLHLQSLPGMVTHKVKARAVELAKKDVEASRDICTELPRCLPESDLLYRLAAAEGALAQL